jgi:hypothetical protein
MKLRPELPAAERARKPSTYQGCLSAGHLVFRPGSSWGANSLLGAQRVAGALPALAFYAGRAGEERGPRVKSGAVTAVQRTSSDLRLNPHLHRIALDGGWREEDGELAWEGLGHLRNSEVGEVLECLVRRMEKYLRRNGQLRTLEEEQGADGEGDPEGNLAASAVSGQAPPAGPQWVSRLAPLEPQALAYDKPLCARSMGSRCTLRRGRALSIRWVGRRCCTTCCALRSRRSGWSSVPTVSCASR